jgi:hypothetical protein
VVGEDAPPSAAVTAVAVDCLCCYCCRWGSWHLGRSSAISAVAAAMPAGSEKEALTSAADDAAVNEQEVRITSPSVLQSWTSGIMPDAAALGIPVSDISIWNRSIPVPDCVPYSVRFRRRLFSIPIPD